MRRTIEKIKERKAITLIALVVTIVVILILAGITVGMVTSDNGILKETKNAKEQAEIDNEKSIVERAKMLAMMRSKDGAITYEIFEPALKDEAGKTAIDVSDAGDTIEVLFTDSNRYYEIDQDGNVSKPQKVVKDEFAGDITKGGRCDGSEEKPYEISCVEDLVILANRTNRKGNYIDENGNIKNIPRPDYLKSMLESVIKRNYPMNGFDNIKDAYSYNKNSEDVLHIKRLTII
jgi:Tfp pilus assembly protein PilE